MKNLLRWIAVLPGAIAAMIFVNIINAFTIGNMFPSTVHEISKAWFGSLAFVLAAYYIAPKGKSLTAIVVATAYCAVGIFAVTFDLRSETPHHSAWLEIITTIISVVASVLAGMLAYSFEKDKNSEESKECPA